MTNRDRAVQFRVAKERRIEGKQVKIGFKKVQVDGIWHTWDEIKEAFVIPNANF